MVAATKKKGVLLLNLTVELADIEIPNWVNWIAQDYSGVWWGFEAEPNEGYDFWYENEVGQYIRLVQSDKNIDWRDSLVKFNSPQKT